MNLGGETGHDHDPIPCPSLLEWRGLADGTELGPSEIRVWLVDLDARLSAADVELAEPGPELDVLAEDERARAARFVCARDRRRFACCRVALRMILGGLLRASPRSVRLRAGGQGKPELDWEASGLDPPASASATLRFNVSHSSELALIAACRGRELGVDIERVRTIHEAERIVASYFSPAEQAEFGTFAADAKVLAFFRGWTRKEAILKGLGIGLAGLSAQFETRFGTTKLSDRFEPAAPSPHIDQWLVWEAAPRAGFVAALAVHTAATTVPRAPCSAEPGCVARPDGEAVD
jgi:4'-phosphopantetheinyl transferase